jgi:hypothetical protein
LLFALLVSVLWVWVGHNSTAQDFYPLQPLSRIDMKLTRFALAAAVFGLASLAHAGKAERDFYAAEVQPAVNAAATTLKQACGCDVKFDVKMSTYETVDQMRQIKHYVSSISSEAGRYCTDAASKKAICQLKSVDISRTSSADFKFSGGKGIATTDESSYPHWGMMTTAIDK